MRRVVFMSGAAVASGVVAATRPAVTTSARSIYTSWGSIALEPWAMKEGWRKRLTSTSTYRSFVFWHVPEASTPPNLCLSAPETYLLSGILDDTQRLLHISWCDDFDAFWHDRVYAHVRLFEVLYGEGHSMSKMVLGDYSSKTAEKLYVQGKLNYLTNVLHWAVETERCYTAIDGARFKMQREIWNALERERYLCSCVEVVETLRQKIPEEFREKAIGELEVQLVNMRHWVTDCANAKRTFTRILA